MKMAAVGNFTAFLAKLLGPAGGPEGQRANGQGDETLLGGRGQATNSCDALQTEYKLSSWKTSAKCHLSYFSVQRQRQQSQQTHTQAHLFTHM